MLGRVGERLLGWIGFLIALGLVALLGVAIWRMGPDGRAALWAGIWRTALWLGIAAALPWVTRLLIRRLLEVGSNWAGVILLGCLTAADLVAGLVLMKGWPSGGWGWVASLAALAAAGTYNYLVTEYLAQQAGG